MADAALVDWMKGHWDEQQALDVTDIADWDRTPKPEQTKLLERFMQLAPQARKPQLLDFGQLTAKLNALSHPEAATPEPEPKPPWGPGERPRTRTPPVPENAEKSHEVKCYHALITEGGRPPFPLDILNEAEARPGDFLETVRPWLGDTHISRLTLGDLGVFERPLNRWREFRRWQRDNRGIQVTDDEDLSTYRDELLRYFESCGLSDRHPDPDWDETSESMWRVRLPARRRERETHREVPGGTFEEYLEAARRRLREHGFDEDPQLLEDAEQQSERVTWIEYLVFEYWWLDRRTLLAQHWEKRRGFIWEKLASMGHLKDGETQEDVLRLRRQNPDQPGSPPTIKRGNAISHFVHAVDKGRSAEVWRSSQQRLVEWALSQLSEKELEAAPNKKTRVNAKKRGHQPATRKRKQAEEETMSPGRPESQPRKKRMVAELESSVPLQSTRASNRDRPRRSARIRGLEKGA